MSHTRAALRQYFGSVGVLLAIGIAWLFLPVVVSAVETRAFPVVADFRITGHRAVPGGIELQAEAVKLRDCDFRKIEVYLGRRPGGVLILNAQFRDPPQERAPGRLSWDALFVPLSWQAIEGGTYADVLHVCYGHEQHRTRSRFW